MTFIKDALAKYNKINKTLPSQVAVYRDGVGGPSYQQYVIDNEIPAIEDSFKTVQ